MQTTNRTSPNGTDDVLHAAESYAAERDAKEKECIENQRTPCAGWISAGECDTQCHKTDQQSSVQSTAKGR